MNITGAVAGNPRFQHIKTVTKTVSNPPSSHHSQGAIFWKKPSLTSWPPDRKGSRADSDRHIPAL